MRHLVASSFFIAFVSVILFSDVGHAFGAGAMTKIDDLYKIAVKSSKFKGVSKAAFKALLLKGGLTKISPFLKNLPKQDRIRLLMEIAEQRKLLTPIEQLRHSAKFSKMSNGDDLLFKVVDHGDKRLFELVPEYGGNLLAIESKSRGAGIKIARNLGDDGLKAVSKIPEQQISMFSNQAPKIAKLNLGDQQKVIDAIIAYPVRALEYLDKNSSILYKATGVTGFLVFIDNISSPKVTKITKPDGTTIETESPIIEGAVEGAKVYVHWLVGILGVALVLWLSIHLWGSWRKKQTSIKMSL
jgi:hypothetical protein